MVFFPSGFLLDKHGPRTTAIVGSLLFFIGNLGFGLGHYLRMFPISFYISLFVYTIINLESFLSAIVLFSDLNFLISLNYLSILVLSDNRLFSVFLFSLKYLSIAVLSDNFVFSVFLVSLN